MAKDIIVGFFIGGAFVSLFALSGDVLKPKSFAGLFGAAPSVALATLILTISAKGAGYAAIETRSMIAGAIAFLIYATCACHMMMRLQVRALAATTLLLSLV